VWTPTLQSCIVLSVKTGELVREFPMSLLSADRTQVLQRDETMYWDYKSEINLRNPVDVAKLAKDVLGFHNARGGVIIIGVTEDYRVVGVSESQICDTKALREKLRKYTGTNVMLFQQSISIPNNRVLWLIFVPKGRPGCPAAAASNGPRDREEKLVIAKDAFYLRENDEVRLCATPRDLDLLFAGHSMEHLHAYLDDVDEPYFRLLAANYDQFFGRSEILARVNKALNSRHHIAALDGLGGVGKTAIAIRLVRSLYESKEYFFIVSLSAKSRVWQGHTRSRRAGFSGRYEFLHETAKVLQLPMTEDPERLKESVIAAIAGYKGLFLVDNIEDVQDSSLLEFLSMEVPEPVKVLVTSRVDRGLGALTISVPEMDKSEARDLLCHELWHAGYTTYINEPEYIEEILEATGRLPLALTWAAGLAKSYGSLKDACRQLRQTDATKREFLNFCFASMYDALSPLAREVALLFPYLAENWNVSSVAHCLSVKESDVSAKERDVQGAIKELEDKGIILASTAGHGSGFRLLPLTMDYLAGKWHESVSLRTRVTQRLFEAAGAVNFEGILLSWPPERRAEVLHKRAELLRANGDSNGAYQLVRLALGWANDPRLRFMEGQILYERGQQSEGLSLMRIAMAQLSETKNAVNERENFASALLAYGGSQGEQEAVQVLADVVCDSDVLKGETVDTFCKLALELREYTVIQRVLRKVRIPFHSYLLTRGLWGVLSNREFIAWCREAVLSTLENALRTDTLTATDRRELEDRASQVSSILKETGAI